MINAVLRLFLNGYLFYSFDQSENKEDYVVTGLKLKKELNTLSNLTISTLITHPKLKEISIKKEVFLLADENRCLFIGRVMSIDKQMLSGEVTIEVEDMMGCMRDSILYDEDENIDPITNKHIYSYSELLTKAINGMTGYGNSNYYSLPKANLEYYDANDDEDFYDKLNEYIYRDVEKSDCLTLIYDIINRYVGGYLLNNISGYYKTQLTDIVYIVTSYKIRYKSTVAHSKRDSYGYLYRNDDILNSSRNIDFEYGYNIINIEQESIQKSVVTHIYGFANYSIANSDSSNNTIKSININITLLNRYGKTSKVLDFGNLGEFVSFSEAKVRYNELMTKYVKNNCHVLCDRLIITGIDRYYLGTSARSNSAPIEIGELVRVVANDYDINQTDMCLSLEIDFFAHENDRYVIGPYIRDESLENSLGDTMSKVQEEKYEELPEFVIGE